MRQTIFTPAYNRADTLPRLWESLKAQSFKDFKWLIVDDGSTDNTKQVVDGFIAENVMPVRYIHKSNGGKHTAQWLAYHEVDTPYVTEVDSDDALLPNAIEDFENAWIQVEGEGKPIAKISMFTQDVNGTIRGFGNYSIPPHIPFVDATWQEFVLKLHNHRELLSSLNVKKFLETYDISKYDLFQDKISCLGESIIWANIGKKYQTRILNKTGLCVYLDAANSILRGKPNYYTGLVGSYYFVEENINYFWWNPKYFSGEVAHFIKCCKNLNISFGKAFSMIHTGIFKCLFIVLFPVVKKDI